MSELTVKEFQFKLSQRVIIKTEDLGSIEGVVSGCKMMTNSPHEYDVHYLLPNLSLQHVVVRESDLVGMQPTKGGIEIALSVDHAPLDEAINKATTLNALIDKAGKSSRRLNRKRSR